MKIRTTMIKPFIKTQDCRASLLALVKHNYTSRIVLDCHVSFKTLIKTNKVNLLWVPGHEGNKEADRCDKKLTKCTFIGPEPACRVSYTLACRCVSNGFWRNTKKFWEKRKSNVLPERILKDSLKTPHWIRLICGERLNSWLVSGFSVAIYTKWGYVHQKFFVVYVVLLWKRINT